MAGRMPTPKEIETKIRVRAFARWLDRQVPARNDPDASVLIAVIDQAAQDLCVEANGRHSSRRFVQYGAYEFFAGQGIAGAWCERYCNSLGLERLQVVAALMELGLWREPVRPRGRIRKQPSGAIAACL